MTDVQLLGQFVAVGDEAAFRALVTRHGPTVLRVCRRVLIDPNDIEDAFQATFLVLLRRAPEIRDPGVLGNWLHGVAYRVAKRARRGAARRLQHERRRGAMGSEGGPAETPSDDLNGVLREELGLLPEAYRVPLELCYLGGLGHEEAAASLGWPLGTLKTRLVRGRRRLRERLDRRGVTASLALLFLLLGGGRSEAVPVELTESTVEILLREASAAPRTADPRHARVARLARACLAAGRGTTWPWSLVLLLLAALAASGGAVVYGRSLAVHLAPAADVPNDPAGVLDYRCD